MAVPAHRIVQWPDLPLNDLDFYERFSDEAACVAHLCAIRWPTGFVCPRCDHGDGWLSGRGYWRCSRCRTKTSATAGTIFHRSHLPLSVWFAAIWKVASSKRGISALELQQALGLGSQETAWTMLHKLRIAMVRPNRDVLSRHVQVDETYVGGKEKGVRGRKIGATKAMWR